MSLLLEYVSQSRPVFMVCDLQVKFAPAFGHNFELCAFVAKRLLAAHAVWPEHTRVVLTEQYPKGLGHTREDITAAAKDLPGASVVEKTRFSMWVPEVEAAVGDATNYVLCGIEAHVCVLQTVADLVAKGKKVHVCVDGVFSQRDADKELALRTMERMGAVLTSSESVLFQLLRDKADDTFKPISGLCREKPPLPPSAVPAS